MHKSNDSLWIQRSSESLRNKTTEALRKAIAEGHFLAGDRLIERELCDLTGVSRTIIRESLSHLEAEGLVRILPNRGPIVATLTIDQIRQIYDVREALEPIAARLFVLHASEDAVASLTRSHKRMTDAFKVGDVQAIAASARTVFQIIRENCGNEFISEFLGRLSTRVDTLRETSMSQKGRLPHSLQEMNAIVIALQKRDSERASVASARHVRAASAAAMEVLKRTPPRTAKSRNGTRLKATKE